MTTDNRAVKRSMLEGLGAAVADGMLPPAETPIYMREALDGALCHVFRSGDVSAVVKKGSLVMLKRKDGREVVLDVDVLRLLIAPFGAVVPYNNATAAVPKLQANADNAGHVFGRLVGFTLDGHDDSAGVFVSERRDDVRARVLAAWNATRGMSVEDLERLA